MRMNVSAEVRLSLTADEALVLFGWLTRDEAAGLQFEHPAEQTVCWLLEAQLEKALLEPLRADFQARLAAARERLMARDRG